MVNCFRKAGISSESQPQSQSVDDDPFKLLAAQHEEFQDRCESPIDFTVNDHVDADEDVANSEANLLTDSEIIARVTQMQQNMMTRMRRMIKTGKCHHQGGIKPVELLTFFSRAVFPK